MRIDVEYTKHPAFAPYLRADAAGPVSVEMFGAADALQSLLSLAVRS